MRYLVQAFLALGALVAAPLLFEAPESLHWQVAVGVGALVLAGLAYRGIVGFVNSRRPKRYPDSIMVPRDPTKK